MYPFATTCTLSYRAFHLIKHDGSGTASQATPQGCRCADAFGGRVLFELSTVGIQFCAFADLARMIPCFRRFLAPSSSVGTNKHAPGETARTRVQSRRRSHAVPPPRLTASLRARAAARARQQRTDLTDSTDPTDPTDSTDPTDLPQARTPFSGRWASSSTTRCDAALPAAQRRGARAGDGGGQTLPRAESTGARAHAPQRWRGKRSLRRRQHSLCGRGCFPLPPDPAPLSGGEEGWGVTGA